MKKNLIILLTMCFCVCMLGCNYAKKAEETEPTKAILRTFALTKNNVYDYFSWDLETENYECIEKDSLGMKVEKATADCKITVYRIVPCTPSNVTIEFEIFPRPGSGWEETQKVRITVPVDGTVTKTISFESKELLKGSIEKPRFDFTNVSVSGTVQVEP